LSPEKRNPEADVVQIAGGSIDRSVKARIDRLGGVEEYGTFAKGFPGTREIRSSPKRNHGVGIAINMSRLAEVCSYPTRANTEQRLVTTTARATEAAEDGRSEVGASRWYR
jgi:hypothetical protein